MDLLALILTLLAVLSMTAHSLLRKYLLQCKAFTERELLIAQCGIGALVCAAWLAAFGEWWNSLATEKPDATMWWLALIVTTGVNIVIQFGNMRATRLADVSFVAPISALTPGLVVLSVLLIGERPGLWGGIGIALIIGGTYAHAREGSRLREYFVPLLPWLVFARPSGREREVLKLRALRWAYGTALFSAVGLIADGLVARHGDMLLAVTIELGVLACVYAAVFKRTAKEEGAFGPFRVRIREHAASFISFGFAAGLIWILLGVAFRLAPIAYIGSLKRLAIFLTVAGGIWLLGEQSGVRRMLLSAIIVVGAVLIAFDPAPSVVLDSADAYLRHLVGR